MPFFETAPLNSRRFAPCIRSATAGGKQPLISSMGIPAQAAVKAYDHDDQPSASGPGTTLVGAEPQQLVDPSTTWRPAVTAQSRTRPELGQMRRVRSNRRAGSRDATARNRWVAAGAFSVGLKSD